MQLGFLIEDYSPERVAKAAELGYDCLSVKSDPNNNTGKMLSTKRGREEMLEVFAKHGVSISAIGAYALYLCEDKNRSQAAVNWLKKVIKYTSEMGIKVIPIITGRNPNLSIDESIPEFKKIFTPLAAMAADHGVRLAMENWMGGWSLDRGINCPVTPETWRKLFEAVPNKALGLEFDPSHLYWQGIDHIRALEEFKDRVYHVHLKDTEMLPEVQYQRGCTGGPFRFRIPGFGEIDWPQFFSKLFETGFKGACVIEHEDPVFSGKNFDEGLRLGINYLAPMFPEN